MAGKSGFRIELIPDMYDLGLFKRALSSRRRLRITTGIAIAGLCLCFLAAGIYIRYYSTTTWPNLILIIVLYIGVIAVSYLLALTFGDVFFSGPWRKKMILGSNYMPDEIKEQTDLLKNKNYQFILIWAASIAFLGFGCDFVTGSHLRWYHSSGGILISMRSTDDEERVHVMRTLSNLFHDKKWQNREIQSKVTELLLDKNEEVRAHAAYIAGRAKIAEAPENLMAALRDETISDKVRGEAAIALGRLEWKPARALLLSVIRKQFEKSHKDEELIPSCLYAFFEMKDQAAARDAISILNACLESNDCGSRVLQYTFFYLKSLRIRDGAAVSFKYLDSDSTTAEAQCYAADILRFTASPGDVPAMKKRFAQTPRDTACPVVYRKYREEAGVILFEDDPMRALFVRAVGNIKEVDSYDWIWMIGSDTTENMQTRKVAEMYARARQKK